MAPSLNDIQELMAHMTEEERQEVDALLSDGLPPWMPLPGPQTMAYESKADIIGYGGAAGGGKTDLACGLALTKHTVSAIFRREATQLTGVIDRLTGILGARDGYNGQEKIWRLDGRQVEFGSTPHLGDETKYQGRPKDLLVLDEATNFLEAQVRFLMGWVRTTKVGQKCTTLLTFNPPTTAEGQWVIAFFGPWLDSQHPNPALPGELRWFATVDGADKELESGEPFEHDGELITPQSRTFIPSNIADNPFLMGTGYMAQLQSLPEPLRSQMLKGDFMAGLEDDPWQIIPSEWVRLAQDRWEPRKQKGEMDSIGCDVSRGGRDETIISPRFGTWFDELKCYPGDQCPDGPTVAGYVIKERRSKAPVHIDIIGWGSSPYDFLVENNIQVIGINGARASYATSREGLKFANLRAELWWRMREALDPNTEYPIALPPDSKLKADLCAPLWKMTKGGIQVEAKDDLKKRIGRSPDRGDAVVMANIDTVKHQNDPRNQRTEVAADWDPFA